MRNFDLFVLSEAKVSARDFPRMAELIISVLGRKSGQRFYRFGGKKGTVLTRRGTGLLYFYGKGQAIRFNHSGNDFESITLWKNFYLGKDGDLTINLKDMNIVGAVDKIVDVILKPKAGKLQFYTESNRFKDNSKILAEAVRIKPEHFYELAATEFGSRGGVIPYVQWEQISDLAVKHDVQVPTVIRKMRHKPIKGAYDLNLILELPDKVKGTPAKEVEQISTIEVVSGDKLTDIKNFAPGVEKEVKKASAKIKQITTNPTQAQVADLMTRVNSLYHDLGRLVSLVAKGFKNSLIIVGGAGTGKTFTVTKTISDEGLVLTKDWFIIKGRITTTALYQMLFIHRDGGLLVFDDTDDVWKDLEAANILKAALDSDDPRMLSWYSARTVNISKMSPNEKEEFYTNLDAMLNENPSNPKIKFPSEFVYRGRIIFISNLPLDKLDAAVLNRSMKIDMTLSAEEIFARIETIVEFINLENHIISLEDKLVVLDVVKEGFYEGSIGDASIRSFVLALQTFASGYSDWRTLIKYG